MHFTNLRHIFQRHTPRYLTGRALPTLPTSPLTRNGISILLLRLLSLTLSFLLAIVLARILGADGYGTYAFALALATLIGIPAQAGLPHLALRETARGLATDDPRLVRTVWAWSTKIALFLSLLTILLLTGVVFLRSPLATSQATLLWALVLILPLALLYLRDAAIRGLGHVILGQLPESVLRPSILLLLLTVFLLPNLQPTPAQAMTLHVVAALGAFLLASWLLSRHTPHAVREASPRRRPGGWLASTFALTLATSMHTIQHHADILLVGYFQPPAQVGIYKVAAQLALLSSFGLGAVNIVVAPRIAELHARNKKHDLQHLLTRTARLALTFTATITVLTLALGQPLLDLAFGPPFADAFLPLLILLLGQLFNSTVGSAGYLLNMTGYDRDTALALTLAAALNVFLNLLLIPIWGLPGAATATSASMIAWNLAVWHRARKRLALDCTAFPFSLQHSNA